MSESDSTNRRVLIRIDPEGNPSVETLEQRLDFEETSDRVYLRAHHTLSWEIDEPDRVSIEFVRPRICPFTAMASEPRLGFEHSKKGLQPNLEALWACIEDEKKLRTDAGAYWRLEIKYDIVVRDGGRLDPVIVIDVPKTQGQGGG